MQKLPNHAYRTRKIASAGRYIDVSHTEHSINLQMQTICYMRKVSIKLAIMNFDVIIHILLTSNILKS